MNEQDWKSQIPRIDRFSEQEKELLDKYFSFYWSLYAEERKPTTDKQKQFVVNCRHSESATPHEGAFVKFLFERERGRMSADRAYGGANGKINYDKMAPPGAAHGDPKRRLISQRLDRWGRWGT